jgi:hypothetical protein
MAFYLLRKEEKIDHKDEEDVEERERERASKNIHIQTVAVLVCDFVV